MNVSGPDSVFRKMGKKALEASTGAAISKLLRLCSPSLYTFLNLRTFPEDIDRFFMGVVKDALRYREHSSQRQEDFLQLMLDLQIADRTANTKEMGNHYT